MKFKQIAYLVLNALASIAALFGIVYLATINGADMSLYYRSFSFVSAFMVAAGGLISIIFGVKSIKQGNQYKGIPHGIFILKMIIAVAAMVTFLGVVTYLEYTDLKNSIPNWYVLDIPLHYVGPLSFVLGFLFFDVERRYPTKYFFVSPVLFLVFIAYSIPLVTMKVTGWEDLYGFLDFTRFQWYVGVLVILIFLVLELVIGFLFWLVNRIIHLIFVGEEVSVDEETSEEEKEAEQLETVEVTKEDEIEVKTIEEEVTKSGYDGPRIYHVSKRKEDGKWQVKFANGQKAIKLFNTQAEAIVFAKKLAKSQDGSIRVHSLKGRIRKAS